MAKRISFDDRLANARWKIEQAEAIAVTPGLKNQLVGMKRVLRIFEGENDEQIKAEKKIIAKLQAVNMAKMADVPKVGGDDGE